MRALRQLFIFVGALVLALSGLAAAVVLRDRSPAPGWTRPAHRCTPRRPCLVIVIDDIGRDLAALDRLLAIPADLTFSVLPHAEHTAQSIERLRRAGREYILHLPMEPYPPAPISDEQVILRAAEPIAPALRRCLAAVPGASGINNHMGSAFSEDPAALGDLFATIAPRRLRVLDSGTSPRSRICAVAALWNIGCAARDVFLDSVPAAVDFELAAASQRARRRGWAIAIGHPSESTIAAMDRLSGNPKGFLSQIDVVRLSTALPEPPDVP